VFAKLAATGQTAAELENAKNGLNGSYLLALNTSSKLADHLVALWIDGLGADYMVQRQQS
jgi:predicted Zn-dependent peptidase